LSFIYFHKNSQVPPPLILRKRTQVGGGIAAPHLPLVAASPALENIRGDPHHYFKVMEPD
jgi:hypothetical protein